jgi:hypothetical protein
MALKYTVDDIVSIPSNLRDEYRKGEDGKIHLVLDGTHPHTTKLSEMRETNVGLLKKLAEFEGLDPVAAKAALEKVAAGDDPDLVKLKLDLAQAQSAAATAAQKTDALVLRQAVSSAFLAVGGRPEAVDYIVGRAPFIAVDGAVKPKEGEASPTVEEWLVTQLDASAFAFFPNTGGGAKGAKPPTLGVRGNVRELINPTPQELGAAAADIKAGKVKVVYTL